MEYRLGDTNLEGFESVKKIKLGKGRNYCVYRDQEPYVSVEVDYYSCFSDAVIFHDYLIIGNYYEGLSVIRLEDLAVEKKDIKGYFGYFEIYDDVLYVLGCEDITAFDKHMDELWVSDFLAYDGIVCDGIDGNIMSISCEMDPPGGWVDKRIDILTGAVLK